MRSTRAFLFVFHIIYDARIRLLNRRAKVPPLRGSVIAFDIQWVGLSTRISNYFDFMASVDFVQVAFSQSINLLLSLSVAFDFAYSRHLVSLPVLFLSAPVAPLVAFISSQLIYSASDFLPTFPHPKKRHFRRSVGFLFVFFVCASPARF